MGGLLSTVPTGPNEILRTGCSQEAAGGKEDDAKDSKFEWGGDEAWVADDLDDDVAVEPGVAERWLAGGARTFAFRDDGGAGIFAAGTFGHVLFRVGTEGVREIPPPLSGMQACRLNNL